MHQHLVDLRIGNEFYISPLILTVFTSMLQFIENYSLVAKIFDLFICKGWVGFFKALVYIFKLLEKKIVDKDYDKILEFLNKSIYETMFLMKLDNIKSESMKMAISKRDLGQLEIEYMKTRQVVESYWTHYYDSRRKNVAILPIRKDAI